MNQEGSGDVSSREHRLSKAAAMFKALGDERRIRIVRQIAENPGICSCRVLEEYDMSQSTLSHHMKLLCEAGLIACEKDGKWVHYTLNQDGFEKAIEALQDLEETASRHGV